MPEACILQRGHTCMYEACILQRGHACMYEARILQRGRRIGSGYARLEAIVN